MMAYVGKHWLTLTKRPLMITSIGEMSAKWRLMLATAEWHLLALSHVSSIPSFRTMIVCYLTTLAESFVPQYFFCTAETCRTNFTALRQAYGTDNMALVLLLEFEMQLCFFERFQRVRQNIGCGFPSRLWLPLTPQISFLNKRRTNAKSILPARPDFHFALQRPFRPDAWAMHAYTIPPLSHAPSCRANWRRSNPSEKEVVAHKSSMRKKSPVCLMRGLPTTFVGLRYGKANSFWTLEKNSWLSK